MTEDNKTRSAGQNQGEGDREAARRFNEDERDFVESGKVNEAVRKAAGQDPEEARRAEQAGRERAKEFDPEVTRDPSKPAKG